MGFFSEQIAAFVYSTTLESIPNLVVRKAKTAIIDGVAVTLGGYPLLGERLISFVEQVGGNSVATIAGGDIQTSAPLAAFANGTLAHALDYDDLNESMGGHPTAPVWSATLAVGEMVQSSGAELILAYILGVEVETKLGAALLPSLYSSGWHPTSVLGTLGAVVAAGKLMNLDHKQLQMALGIAASFASGFKQNFGTTVKPLHVGQAAKNGVTAAILAKGGWDAALDSLEGENGFCRLFCNENQNEWDRKREGVNLSSLGKPWEFESPGIKQKKYPCCGSIHSSLDALLELMEEEGRGIEIERLHCTVHSQKKHILIHPKPKTGLEAKFSLEYCIATTLQNRCITLKQFSDNAVTTPQIQVWLPKIIISTDNKMPKWGSIIQIETNSGERLEKRCDAFPGISNKVDLMSKFHDCGDALIGRDRCDELMALLWKLEDLEKVSELTRLMTRSLQSN